MKTAEELFEVWKNASAHELWSALWVQSNLLDPEAHMKEEESLRYWALIRKHKGVTD